MLQLKDITKEYPTAGGESVHALRGVSVDFRDNEFVAILGQSGCGKTTLLNIVGGLDSYTSGDLVINGRSTKEYKAADWDAYRNSSVGFVFQSYNLIMHQSVLSNVELALKISGCSKEDRRARAVAALERVGLGDQIHKKPGMMSGGQMQRVAIARALVNDPAIILADEPTGALDSKTSVQIMDLLKEVAADRLVVMVTHNPELADEYATRIVRLQDGEVVSDSNPVATSELPVGEQARPKHVRLGFLAALELSANNLRTKKGRTLLTAFAGAIGIIGIALILSISNGTNDYIKKMETDTMGDYPIELERTTIDLSSMMDEKDDAMTSGDSGLSLGSSSAATTSDAAATGDAEGTFTSKNVVAKATSTVNSLQVTNNLGAFKSYLDDHISDLDGSVTAVETSYDVEPQVYRTKDDSDADAGYVQVSPADLTDDSTMKTWSDSTVSSMYSSMGINASTTSKWSQLVDDDDLRNSQYQLLAGDWPTQADEVALVVSSNGKVSDFDLYTMGLLNIDDMTTLQDAVNNDESYDDSEHTFTYDEALGREYRVFSKADFYGDTGETGDTGQPIWVDKSSDDGYVATLYDEDKGVTVHVTAVLQATDSAQVSSGVAYTGALVDDLIDEAASTDVVRQQVADPSVNVLTGKAFTSDDSDISDDGSTAGANATTAETDTTTQSAFVSKEAAETVAATAVGTYHPSDNQLMHAERATASGSSMGQVVDEVGTSAGTATTTGSAAATTGSASTGTAATTGAATSPTTPDAATTGISDAELAQVISELTAAQRQTLLTSLLSGMTDDQKAELVKEFGGSSTDVSSLTDAQRQALLAQMMASMSDEEKAALIKQYGGSSVDTSAIEQYAQQYAEQYVSEHASELVQRYLSSLSDAEVAALMGGSALDLSSVSGLSSLALSQDQLEALVAQYSDTTPSSYDDVLSALGYVDRAQPSEISIYPTDFDGKEQVSDLIDAYNAQVSSSDDKVTYTDLVGTMTSSVTEIVDTVSTVLIAFVAISLVVSSIMIAIITYISVLERTKEIGVLRALGASKGDVSKIFNAETFIEGLISGLLGIGVTLLLSIPINAVVESQLNVANISQLTPANAAVLIGLSVALTLIAGLIPSLIASKKDPAVALRSE